MSHRESGEPGFGARFLAHWVTFAARHAFVVVLLGLLSAGAVLAYTGKHLRITTDRDAMLSANLSFRKNDARFQREFPQFKDNLIVVVTAQNPEFARRAALRLGAELEGERELFRTVYLPKAEPFLERHAFLFLGLDALRDLSDRLVQVQPFLGRLTHDPSLRGLFTMVREAVEARADGNDVDLGPILGRVDETVRANLAGTEHVLSWQELLRDDDSPDARRQFLVLQPRLDYSTMFPGKPAIAAIKQAAADLELDEQHGVSVRLTGGVALGDEELLSVMDGAALIAVLATLSVVLTLWIGLRSARLVAATLITLAVGLAYTAGFAIVAVGHLNLISVAFAMLYLGLGVDYAIHIGLRYRELVENGSDHLVALQTMATDIGGSVFVCALTTALGFYAFVPTAYSGVSELGLISGTGMFVSFVVTFTLMPALLTLLRPTFATKAERRELFWLKAITELPFRHRKAVRWATLLLALGSLPLLARARFDANPMNLRSPQAESVATFRELLETSSTPPWSLQVLEQDPRKSAEQRSEILGLALVDKVVSLESYVPEHQNEKLELLADAALVLGPTLELDSDALPPQPAQRAQATQELADALGAYMESEAGRTDSTAARLRDGLLELLGRRELPALERLERSLVATLPDNLEMLSAGLEAGPVTRADLPAELVARWRSAGGLQRLEVFPSNDLEAPGAMREFVDAVRDLGTDVTGAPLMIVESGKAVVHAFQESFLMALLATTVVLVLMLRDAWDVCRVLGVLLLAGLWTGACVELAGTPFNFANVIGLPLLLGIGVDSGVHVLHRARLRLEDHGNLLRTSTARAVVLSSLTTFLSFANLSLSEHRGTASMGFLLALGMGWTLVTSLLVLPAFLPAFLPSAQPAAPASELARVPPRSGSGPPGG